MTSRLQSLRRIARALLQVMRTSRFRLLVCAVFMIMAMSVLAARLVYLHLGLGIYTERAAQIDKIRSSETEITVERGKIRDRKGKILALDLVRKTLCADPSRLQSNGLAQAVAQQLALCLKTDVAPLAARLGKSDSKFVYLLGYGQTLDVDQAETIAKLKLPGVFFQDAQVRTYPRGNGLCHVLGYVNLEGAGSGGIEQKWEHYLSGVPGLIISEKDGKRIEQYDRRTLQIRPHQGADVVLTLDHYVQYVAERALERGVREQNAVGGWALVTRVRTGEILAMASYPLYDPNQFQKAQKEQMRNRCIAYNYEPGSTFKIAIVAAALNEGLVKSSQIFDCEGGTWFYQKKALKDFHPYGLLSVADIIKKSSNIGAAKIALLLGPDRLYAYLKAFGIGQLTGVELPGEEGGILYSPARWTGISATRIAIGHEVAVTALQMVGVMSAIANDGVLMKPYLVQRVEAADGAILYQRKPAASSRAISPETAAEMRRLLVRVTEPGGTATKAQVPGYTVGGKTGTAQKPVRGGYSDSLNMASFTGFIPAEDPQLAIIVVLDEPKSAVHTGGAVAAPVFREIAEESVKYLDIPPLGTTVVAQHDASPVSLGLAMAKP